MCNERRRLPAKLYQPTQEASIAHAFQDIANAGRTLSYVKVI